MSFTREKIRARRVALGLSQYALAKKTQYMSQSKIAKIESGKTKISLDDLLCIAGALETSVENLIDVEAEQHRSQSMRRKAMDLTDKELEKIYEDYLENGTEYASQGVRDAYHALQTALENYVCAIQQDQFQMTYRYALRGGGK